VDLENFPSLLEVLLNLHPIFSVCYDKLDHLVKEFLP